MSIVGFDLGRIEEIVGQVRRRCGKGLGNGRKCREERRHWWNFEKGSKGTM